MPTHKCIQEPFLNKYIAEMDKKFDTLITEIKDFRKESKDTYATKEELSASAELQDLKNDTVNEKVNKLNDIVNKLVWVVIIAVAGSLLQTVLK